MNNVQAAIDNLKPDAPGFVGDLSQVLGALRELGLPRADDLADAIERYRAEV